MRKGDIFEYVNYRFKVTRMYVMDDRKRVACTMVGGYNAGENYDFGLSGNMTIIKEAKHGPVKFKDML